MVCCVISLSNIIRLAILAVLVAWFVAWLVRTPPFDGAVDVEATFGEIMKKYTMGYPNVVHKAFDIASAASRDKEPVRSGWLW